MPVIEIGAKNFIAGESTSDLVSDRGFSPKSNGLNLTKTRGMFYFRESGSEVGSSTLTGNIVASTFDPRASGNDSLHVDDEANFYTYSGTTLTKRQTGANTYQLGTSELINFKSQIYATSQTAVAQLNDQMSSMTENWWSGLTAGYRHPMEAIEDELFIADKNVIYYWNGSSSGIAFTLPDSRIAVTSLRKAPDGRTLLAFTSDNEQNFSHTLGGGGKVYYCNPVLRDWEREVQLEAQVEGSRVVGGTIFVTYGSNFGYYDGNGLQPLYRFETSTTTYSHNISNIEDILIFRDGKKVVAYGDLGAGNTFWKLYGSATNNINNIHYKGDNKLLVAFSDGAGGGDLYEIDYDNAGIIGDFYSNRYTFGGEVIIRRIKIFHDETNSAGTSRFTLGYNDINGSLSDIKDVQYTNQSTYKTVIDCDIQTDMFQLYIAPQNDDLGYKLIQIFYEPVEQA